MKLLGITGYKQSGKSTLSDVARYSFQFRQMHFAEELKIIILRLWPAFTGDHAYGELKEEVVEEYGKSFREVAQVVGTDLFRNYDPDVWVRALREKIRVYYEQMGPTSGRPIVIDDIRFDNEAALIRELGGEVWEVVRPEKDARFERDTHKSELGLLASSVDMVIPNTLNLADYTAMCRRMLEEFVNER